jgi:hypothetical protein
MPQMKPYGAKPAGGGKKPPAKPMGKPPVAKPAMKPKR